MQNSASHSRLKSESFRLGLFFQVKKLHFNKFLSWFLNTQGMRMTNIIPPISFICTFLFLSISSVQLLSHVWLFVTRWTAAHQASLSFTNSWSLLKLMSIESVMPSNHLILSAPPPAFNPSQHLGLFQSVSSSHQVAKVLQFQLQHQ